ncbi:hypothetical protein SC499_01090 [Peribacillus simplex]|uniref:hypothetical protein n=1 Tax=Peribacillus TaxID=2675229 RepID=UPI0029534276|nr:MULTISPECIES: hypothetical protein [Peribacillus]MDV7763287.1 hypothetical protein [Peribacillus sp. CSMR9]MDW7613347.1 hypothetical protein [Peribacillus simplex]
MSLKAIEMQIAIPRTQDAGKIQEQNQQKNLIQQDHAAHQVQKDSERKQRTVVGEERKLPAHFYEKALFVKIVVFKTKLFKVDWSGSARLLREQRDR